jgi:hypothetical protein
MKLDSVGSPEEVFPLDGVTAGLCLEGAITLLTLAADCIGKMDAPDRLHAEASLDLAIDQCRVVRRMMMDRIMGKINVEQREVAA